MACVQVRTHTYSKESGLLERAIRLVRLRLPALHNVEVHGVAGLLEVPLHMLPPEPQERAHVHVHAPLRPLHKHTHAHSAKSRQTLTLANRGEDETEHGGTGRRYRGVEGDAALVLVDAAAGLRDADLVEVRAEEIHGRGRRRAAPGEGRV